MHTYNLGLVSVSFRQNSPEEILSEMRKVNLSCIEWGGDIHAPFENQSRLYEIAALQKEYGIYCSSYGSYFKIGKSPFDEINPIIQAAGILGAKIIRIWAGDKTGRSYTAKEKAEFFDLCRRLSSAAEAKGVTLCLECHNDTYTDTKESAIELMEAVHSPYFKMYWQPNQYQSPEENMAYANLLEPYIEHIHVFNWTKTEKYPLIQAKDIWKAYLSAFSGEKTLLLEFMPDNRIETLNTETNALRNIVGEMK